MGVAGALVVLAVYLLVKKGPPRTVLLMVLAAIAIAIGSVAAPGSSPDVHVLLATPKDGATVPAREPVDVRVTLTGADRPLLSSDSGAPSGHLHVLVDGEIVSMSSALVTEVTLSPGPHTIEAEVVAADHRPLSPRVIARANVTARTTP